jgi:hypothetical protein
MRHLDLEVARPCARLPEMESLSLQTPTIAEVLLLVDFRIRSTAEIPKLQTN